MVELFRVLILMYAFCVRFTWCQNTTTTTTTVTTSCRPGDIRCSANGKGGDSSSATTVDSTTTNETKSPSTLTESLRGRAMNFTSAFQENMRENGLEAASSIPANKPNAKEHSSIDDVSIDEMDNEYSMNLTDPNLTNLMSSMTLFNDMMNAYQVPKNSTSCTDRDNKVYKLGEKFNRGCDETCQCLRNGVVCSHLCKTPYHVKGRNRNSSCTEVPVEGNSCCVTLSCSPRIDLDAEAVDGCVYKNKTYKKGRTFEDGCDSICSCGASGHVTCENRCPVRNETEKCVLVTDPQDSCCKILLCDVEEHNVNKMDTTASDDGLSSSSEDNQITSVKLLNSTSVILTFAERTKDCNVEMSTNGIDWENVKCSNGIVSSLESGKKYRFRLKNMVSNKVEITIPSQNQTPHSSCDYRGKTYEIGEEFHDGCRALCVCEVTGIECALIECPTDFGLDVLDPQCLDWETYPVNFVPTPPLCCPERVQCRNNGSCVYNGEWFSNSAELPAKITGCKDRCYCELNKVTCQERCSPVSAPPADLHCPQGHATLARSPGDECCSEWTCPNNQSDEIQIHVLEAVDESTVKLVFAVPSFLVGLNGRIELRYTSDQTNNEPSTWEQQILAPPNDLIATKELEFELGGLQPDTTYKIKISVMMHDIDNAPTSQILRIKTLAFAPTTTAFPSIIPKDPDLRAIEVNSTYAKIGWRTFSDFELRFIDGVQLRYKEIDDKVYQATPLIHRAVTTYTIEKLKPDSIYEVGIFFIPFPGQTTELQAQRTIEIRTSIENDPYKFDITMDLHNVKTTSVEIRWSGVPYPEDKFVNIFRAIYQSDGNREDSSSFKVAKRDSPQSILIQDLKPATRYRLWLEAYLTNGRTKKSNVKDFITKLGPGSSSSTSQGKLEGMALMESNSYYGPLVAVSIVATIAIMSTIILLLVLARKHGTNKAPITSPINRKNNSSAAYDNPTYKVDIQQETMDL